MVALGFSVSLMGLGCNPRKVETIYPVKENPMRLYFTPQYSASSEGWKLQGQLSGGLFTVPSPVDLSLVLTSPDRSDEAPRTQLHVVLRSGDVVHRETRLQPVFTQIDTAGTQFDCKLMDVFGSDLRYPGTVGLPKGEFRIDVTMVTLTIALKDMICVVGDQPVGH